MTAWDKYGMNLALSSKVRQAMEEDDTHIGELKEAGYQAFRREERADRIEAALKADLEDAKAVCGGDGKGCEAYRHFYECESRRHRKCGRCPMDTLATVREVLEEPFTE